MNILKLKIDYIFENIYSFKILINASYIFI